MNNPIIFTGRSIRFEKVIESLIEKTKGGSIQWEIAPPDSIYNYKSVVAKREVYISNPNLMKVGGNEECQPFIYRDGNVRRLHDTVSSVLMPESLKEWMNDIIDE